MFVSQCLKCLFVFLKIYEEKLMFKNKILKNLFLNLISITLTLKIQYIPGIYGYMHSAIENLLC